MHDNSNWMLKLLLAGFELALHLATLWGPHPPVPSSCACPKLLPGLSRRACATRSLPLACSNHVLHQLASKEEEQVRVPR